VHESSLQKALELVVAHGYALLFLASVAENVFLLGMVVPGDVIVVLGGALSARAHLAVAHVAIVVVVGALLGANLSFWIGRRGGMALVERWGERTSPGRVRVQRVEDYFHRHGAKTVFLAAFVAGIKNLVPTVAGASRMPVLRFVLYNAAGCAARSVALVGIGYFLGANLPRAVKAIGSFNLWALALVALLGVAFAVLRRARRRPKSSRGE